MVDTGENNQYAHRNRPKVSEKFTCPLSYFFALLALYLTEHSVAKLKPAQI